MGVPYFRKSPVEGLWFRAVAGREVCGSVQLKLRDFRGVMMLSRELGSFRVQGLALKLRFEEASAGKSLFVGGGARVRDVVHIIEK